MIGSKEISSSESKAPLKPPRLYAWTGSAVVMSTIIATELLPRGDNPYLRGTGVLVLLLAAGFIFAPFFRLTRHGRTQDGKSYMQAEAVVDRGLYAIIRHPQYLGYISLACGYSLLSQHWAAVLLTAAGFISFYIQAVKEERYCSVRYRKHYAQYCRRVPRLNVFLGLTRLLRGGGK